MSEANEERAEDYTPQFSGPNIIRSMSDVQMNLTFLLEHADLDDEGQFTLHDGMYLHVDFGDKPQVVHIIDGETFEEDPEEIYVSQMDCTAVRVHWPDIDHPLDPILLELTRHDEDGNMAIVHADPALLSDLVLVTEDQLRIFDTLLEDRARFWQPNYDNLIGSLNTVEEFFYILGEISDETPGDGVFGFKPGFYMDVEFNEPTKCTNTDDDEVRTSDWISKFRANFLSLDINELTDAEFWPVEISLGFDWQEAPGAPSQRVVCYIRAIKSIRIIRPEA